MFRFFERITEFIGWLQIAAAPSLIGTGVGAAMYFAHTTLIRLVIGGVIAVAGIVIGCVWATRVMKSRNGTVWFMSRIIATPELDNETKEH